jgi:hypothetical protein
MSQELHLSIADGSLQFICCDDLEPLLGEGQASVNRVSHVEYDNTRQAWFADMSPVGGETLGPYTARSNALKAEHQWLIDNRGL